MTSKRKRMRRHQRAARRAAKAREFRLDPSFVWRPVYVDSMFATRRFEHIRDEG